MPGEHILLVEDDKSLAFVIQDNLKVHGYKTTHASNGVKALELYAQGVFDLCLMDVMMPEMDGFECAKRIRTLDSSLPILFLTARSMDEDVHNGFKSGGDDYIVKPFNFKELLFRIAVFLRRSNQVAIEDEVFQLTAKSNFDFSNLSLETNKSSRKLTYKEGCLLKLLAENRNKLLKREDILLKVWGDDDYFLGRSLDVFISKLRKYLVDDNAIEIRNIHGVGFEFRVVQ